MIRDLEKMLALTLGQVTIEADHSFELVPQFLTCSRLLQMAQAYLHPTKRQVLALGVHADCHCRAGAETRKQQLERVGTCVVSAECLRLIGSEHVMAASYELAKWPVAAFDNLDFSLPHSVTP